MKSSCSSHKTNSKLDGKCGGVASGNIFCREIRAKENQF